MPTLQHVCVSCNQKHNALADSWQCATHGSTPAHMCLHVCVCVSTQKVDSIA